MSFGPDDLVIFHVQSVHGQAFAALDARLAADAALRMVLRHGHADDAEIVESRLGAVIGTAGERDLEVQVVGENSLLDALCKFRRIVVGEGTDVVADAGADVAGAGCRITGAGSCLIDVQQLNDRLKHFVDLVHVLQLDALDLKSLTGGQMHDAVSVCFRDVLYHSQDLRFQAAAGYADSCSAFPADLADPVCIFLCFLCIDIQTHDLPPNRSDSFPLHS